MKMFVASLGLALLSSYSSYTVAGDEMFTGLQKYKLDRVEEFLSRMDRSAAKVNVENNLSVSLSFSNYHKDLVDRNLTSLLSQHDRELPFTSVTYHIGNMDMGDFESHKLLSSMNVHQTSTNSVSYCKVNSMNGCRVFTIQFYATERGQ
tara:strand:+ start:185 stop:631 length:447 start_codon:yes stop_codon:yes gene_type:complete